MEYPKNWTIVLELLENGCLTHQQFVDMLNNFLSYEEKEKLWSFFIKDLDLEEEASK